MPSTEAATIAVPGPGFQTQELEGDPGDRGGEEDLDDEARHGITTNGFHVDDTRQERYPAFQPADFPDEEGEKVDEDALRGEDEPDPADDRDGPRARWRNGFHS